MPKSEYTSQRVHVKTVERVKPFMKYGMTFDGAVNYLVDKAEQSPVKISEVPNRYAEVLAKLSRGENVTLNDALALWQSERNEFISAWEHERKTWILIEKDLLATMRALAQKLPEE